MLYEYEISNDVSKVDIENMLIKSRTLKRNYANFFIFSYFAFLSLLVLIGLILGLAFDVSIFTKKFIIILGICMVVCVFIMILRRKNGAKIIAKSIESSIYKKRVIEISNDICKYICDDFKIRFNRKSVIEVLKFDKYTLVFVAPKLLKYIIFIDPIIIPNNLFGDEEKYNEFINRISK